MVVLVQTCWVDRRDEGAKVAECQTCCLPVIETDALGETTLVPDTVHVCGELPELNEGPWLIVYPSIGVTRGFISANSTSDSDCDGENETRTIGSCYRCLIALPVASLCIASGHPRMLDVAHQSMFGRVSFFKMAEQPVFE